MAIPVIWSSNQETEWWCRKRHATYLPASICALWAFTALFPQPLAAQTRFRTEARDVVTGVHIVRVADEGTVTVAPPSANNKLDLALSLISERSNWQLAGSLRSVITLDPEIQLTDATAVTVYDAVETEIGSEGATTSRTSLGPRSLAPMALGAFGSPLARLEGGEFV